MVITATVWLQPYTSIYNQTVAVAIICSFFRNSKGGGLMWRLTSLPLFKFETAKKIWSHKLIRIAYNLGTVFPLKFQNAVLVWRFYWILFLWVYGCHSNSQSWRTNPYESRANSGGGEFFFFTTPKLGSRRDAHSHFSSPIVLCCQRHNEKFPFFWDTLYAYNVL